MSMQLANHKVTRTKFYKSAKPHSYKVGDLVIYSEYNFLGKNKKLTPKFLGLATVNDVNDKCQNQMFK